MNKIKRPDVKNPRGSIIINGNNKAEIVWNPDFAKSVNKKFSRAQMFVDSEVYRRCEPYTPMLTGMLKLSGELGTVFGQGYVEWIAPYAVYQYYMPNKIGSERGPLRGPFWFERMKEVHGDAIIQGAAIIIGGEVT